MQLPGVACPLLLLLTTFTSVTTGCVSMLMGPSDNKSDRYELIPPPAPWVKTDPGNADIAFKHRDDQATMSLNSVCDQYQELSLDELTKSLMLGLDQPHDEKVEKLQIDGFPAQKTTLSGKAEDTDVTISYTVMRSDYCVYDFMLVARSAVFARHQQAYNDLLQRFHERKAH